MLKKWSELPKEFRCKEVEYYYKNLYRRQFSIRAKRMLDVLLALFLIILLSPVMLITALLIKLDSRGPVFFRQERITQYGKTFRIFKFRTMVDGADRKGPLVTESGDSRITKMGNKLRKLRIDEVPQLFNILTGDMTFVGTRPEVKKYVDKYTAEMKATLLLPAGITSRTSIAYKDEDDMIEKYKKEYPQKSADEIYPEYILPVKMQYNLEYLKSFSIFEDIKIMLQTVIAVLR